MLIHDPADIFLELAKVMNYTSKGKGHQWLKLYTDITFAIFAIVFFITRVEKDVRSDDEDVIEDDAPVTHKKTN
eukprot:gene20733-26882_t